MKHLLILICLTALLTACHGKDKKKSKSVLENKQSLVNQWYGPNYFIEKENNKQSEPLNQSSDANATEIDAGGMGGANDESCPPPTTTGTAFLNNELEGLTIESTTENTVPTEISIN